MRGVSGVVVGLVGASAILVAFFVLVQVFSFYNSLLTATSYVPPYGLVYVESVDNYTARVVNKAGRQYTATLYLKVSYGGGQDYASVDVTLYPGVNTIDLRVVASKLGYDPSSTSIDPSSSYLMIGYTLIPLVKGGGLLPGPGLLLTGSSTYRFYGVKQTIYEGTYAASTVFDDNTVVYSSSAPIEVGYDRKKWYKAQANDWYYWDHKHYEQVTCADLGTCPIGGSRKPDGACSIYQCVYYTLKEVEDKKYTSRWCSVRGPFFANYSFAPASNTFASQALLGMLHVGPLGYEITTFSGETGYKRDSWAYEIDSKFCEVKRTEITYNQQYTSKTGYCRNDCGGGVTAYEEKRLTVNQKFVKEENLYWCSPPRVPASFNVCSELDYFFEAQVTENRYNITVVPQEDGSIVFIVTRNATISYRYLKEDPERISPVRIVVRGTDTFLFSFSFSDVSISYRDTLASYTAYIEAVLLGWKATATQADGSSASPSFTVSMSVQQPPSMIEPTGYSSGGAKTFRIWMGRFTVALPFNFVLDNLPLSGTYKIQYTYIFKIAPVITITVQKQTGFG